MFSFIFTDTFMLRLFRVLLFPFSLGISKSGTYKTSSASSYTRLFVTMPQHCTMRKLLLSALLRSFLQLGFFLTKGTGALLCRVLKLAKKSLRKSRHAWIKPSQLHLEAADKLLLIGISLLCIVFALVATLHKVILQNRLQLQKLQT